MTKGEKIRFVNELIYDIHADIVDKISTDKIPEHWAGSQLRKLVAERFGASIMGMDRSEMARYRHECMVNGL